VKIHCNKRLAIFPVIDIPAGDGKIANLFYSVLVTRTLILFVSMY